MESDDWAGLLAALVIGSFFVATVWAVVHYNAGAPWDGIATVGALIMWIAYSVKTLSKP